MQVRGGAGQGGCSSPSLPCPPSRRAARGVCHAPTSVCVWCVCVCGVCVCGVCVCMCVWCVYVCVVCVCMCVVCMCVVCVCVRTRVTGAY